MFVSHLAYVKHTVFQYTHGIRIQLDRALTPKQQLIGVIALAALSLLSVFYLMRQCFQKNATAGHIQQLKERNSSLYHQTDSIAAYQDAIQKSALKKSPLEGPATYILPDGERWNGPFKDGLLDGPGRIDSPCGKSLKAVFSKGTICGKVQVTYPEGDIWEGEAFVRPTHVDVVSMSPDTVGLIEEQHKKGDCDGSDPFATPIEPFHDDLFDEQPRAQISSDNDSGSEEDSHLVKDTLKIDEYQKETIDTAVHVTMPSSEDRDVDERCPADDSQWMDDLFGEAPILTDEEQLLPPEKDEEVCDHVGTFNQHDEENHSLLESDQQVQSTSKADANTPFEVEETVSSASLQDTKQVKVETILPMTPDFQRLEQDGRVQRTCHETIAWKEGEFSPTGLNGYGKIQRKCGGLLEGEFKDGQLDCDFGRLTLADGTIYEGAFQAGELFGWGKVTHPNGDFESGTFLKGKLHGQGKIEFADGRVTIGNFKNGAIEGRETCISPSRRTVLTSGKRKSLGGGENRERRGKFFSFLHQ